MERKSLIGNLLLSGTLLLVCALFLTRNLFLPIVVYDEGLILCGASRVLCGDLPYKSFWSIYAPGQFYSLAFLFRIFGESVVTERLWDLAIRSFLAVACYWLIRGNASKYIALLCISAVTTWLWFFTQPGYPVYPFLLAMVLCVVALMNGITSGSKKSIILAALLAGISMIFRHDMGLLTIIAISMALGAVAIHSHFRRHPQVKFRWHLAFLFPALRGFVWAGVRPEQGFCSMPPGMKRALRRREKPLSEVA